MSCCLLRAKSFHQVLGGYKPGPSFIPFLLALSRKATVHDVPGNSYIPFYVLASSTRYSIFYFFKAFQVHDFLNFPNMMENMLQVHFRGFSRLVTLESNNLFITIKQAVIYFATVMLVEVGNCASNGKTQKSRDSKNTWHFGTRRDAKGLMFSPMRAGDKKVS